MSRLACKTVYCYCGIGGVAQASPKNDKHEFLCPQLYYCSTSHVFHNTIHNTIHNIIHNIIHNAMHNIIRTVHTNYTVPTIIDKWLIPGSVYVLIPGSVYVLIPGSDIYLCLIPGKCVNPWI